MNPSPETPLARRTGLALLLVIALGAFLRFHGIGFLLPEQTESDAVVYSAQVKDFQDGTIHEETTRLYAFYPHLVSRLAAGIAAPRAYATPARNLAEHLERAAEPRRRIRITVALLSLLAIPAAWLLARRFLAPPFALAAAVFMASSFFTLWFAQQARPHAASSAFAALAVVAAVHLRAVGGWKAFVGAGLAAGLAIGSLQSGIAVLPAVALAVCLRWRAAPGERRQLVGGSLVVLALVAILVVLYYPFMFMRDVPGQIGQQNSILSLMGHIIDLKLFNGGGFATLFRSMWEYEPVISALALLGAILGALELWTRRKSMTRDARDQVWVALAFVVPYTIVIGMYERTYQRFALPLIPFACVMAAFALCRIISFAARFGDWPRRLTTVAAGLVVAFQVFAAWRLSDARAQPSTIEEAARWIESNVPRDARISLLPMMELPLQFTPAAFEASMAAQYDVAFMWFRYLHELGPAAFEGRLWNIYAMRLLPQAARDQVGADADAYVRSLDADYAVMPVVNQRRWVPLRIREAAARLGQRVARISPDANDTGEDVDFGYQDDDYERTTAWFARGLNVRCVGPVVEIYKLR